MSVEGRVIVVAGVGDGLGTAVVSVLASAGATVVGLARSSGILERLASEGQSRRWRFESRVSDSADPAAAQEAIRAILRTHQRIDGLAVLVGRWVGGETLAHRMSDAEWKEAMAANLDPAFFLCRAVLPSMMERGEGSVVLVGASEAVRWAGSASYATAKAGVAELAQKLARDYRSYGVRVNAVLPGSMAPVRGEDPPDPKERRLLGDENDQASWDVAWSIKHLLSSDARWVTGALLVVDGGGATGGTPQSRSA
ncbi:MAG TPA: SDR family NAD(P)-dependent oxidoreductase [Thermoplasmata archaeon]|nr:SDR family NAD(P)-dependent oxidoreductase [Thermoplasmata archaeon]